MNGNKIISQRILACYIEKGRKPAPLGTLSKDGNSVKTNNGWEPVKRNKTKMENKTNSTGHKVMDEIIDAIKPDLNKVINAYKKEAIKDGKGFTKRDEEYVELLYTFKLAQSIGNYVKPDDS